MKEKEIALKKEKKKFLNKLTSIFENKKKRYLYMILFMLPFIIAIGIYSFISYKEVKELLSLATGNETNTTNIIESMNYQLRNNATDIQKQYFEELKNAINDSSTTDADVAGIVCKNYVADFYTWTNKQGQYDVGGLHYVYTNQKEAIYKQARDTFYKYLSNYIKEYKAENLLEVESVEVVSAKNLDVPYVSVVSEHFYDTEAEEHYYEDVEHEYDAYEVTCSWSYKLNEKFDTSKYATQMNFIVVLNDGRYEIVEASEKKIDVRKVEEKENDEKDELDESSESNESYR